MLGAEPQEHDSVKQEFSPGLMSAPLLQRATELTSNKVVPTSKTPSTSISELDIKEAEMFTDHTCLHAIWGE